MATIGTYVAEFTANVDGLIQGSAKGSMSIEGLTGSIVKGQLAVEAIGAAAKIAFQIVSETLKQVTLIAANYGDEMLAASQKTGIATEALGGLKFAAEQSNASFSDLTTGLAQLSKNMVAANDPSSRQAQIFHELGVATKDASGHFRSTNDVLLDLADRINMLPDAASQATIRMALMGRGAEALAPLMSGGSAAINDLTNQAVRFNAVVSKEGAAAGDAFNDALGSMKLAMLGLSLTIGTQLLPILTNLINALADVVAAASTWVKNNPQIIQSFVNIGQAVVVLSGTAIGGLLHSLDTLLSIAALVEAAIGTKGVANALAGAANFAGAMSAAVQQASLDFLKNIDAIQPLNTELEKISFNWNNIGSNTDKAAKALKEWQKTLAEIEFARILNEQNAINLAYSELIRIWMADAKAADELAAAADKLKISLDTATSLEGQKLFFDTWHENIRIWMAEAAETEKRNKEISESGIALWKEQQAHAEQTSKAFSVALGNITSDFAKAFSDIIFEGMSFAEAMTDLFKITAKSMLNAFITGLISPLTDELAKLGRMISKTLSAALGGGGGGGGFLSGLLGALGGGILGPIGLGIGAFGLFSQLFGGGGSNTSTQPTSQYFDSIGASVGGFSGNAPGPLPVYGPDSPAYQASQRPINSVINIYGSVGVADIARALADELRRLTGDSGMIITGAH